MISSDLRDRSCHTPLLIGLGTLLNAAAILVGAALGVLLGNRLPESTRESAMDGLGMLTLVLGVTMGLQTQNFLYMTGAVLIGGLIGESLRLERRLEWLGDWFQARLASTSSSFSTGFVTASLIFCIGPMAIVGSLEDGLRGTIEVLTVKSIMDGIASVAFAATLGWGVALSALSVLVYQGLLTLAAGLADRVLTDAMITEMTATGGVLVLMIGMRLMDLKRVRVGNFLPALLVAPLLVALVAALRG